MKKFLATVAFATLALPAQAFDITSMDDQERSAFRAEVRAYLLENPEVILEAYQIFEQRQANAEAQKDETMIAAHNDAIYNDDRAWVGGNPEGDITLVEFMDYRCGYCRKAHGEVAELVETDGNIRYIVKEFPILGDESVLASRFAIATKLVAGDAAYEKTYDALINFRGNIGQQSLARLAETLDLDGDAIMAQMNSPEVNQLIGDNHVLARDLSISGTPTFILGDQMLRGYVPLANMMELVAAVREAK
ncbi:protein disulfide isomerase II DsbC [Thalassovita gelatinovora]|uniref:Protein disulfide isomerase II DsbC n=1 Tax=Thalassovita gelatinovora TaxID=53501 RepID=A0A0P1FET8_THAGE|nr:DsbA family protein [Thalassovita gelatinovora]QIZ79690.1 DsbA family protein [Thalassovita gelatinovora]CUH66672.1 protein disulfide isomerase II DsbC [Thalassovita gelatinovora]SEQ40329.1 Protein-disulfide isomerase [Thalassovita gelatinovora]